MDVPCYELIKNLAEAEVRESYLDTVREQRLSIAGVERQAIFAHPPSSVAYQLALPPQAWLDVSCGLDAACWEQLPEKGVTFEIWIEADESQEVIWSRTVDPQSREDDRRWLDTRIDLAPFGGRAATLVFITHTAGNDNSSCWSFWGDPRVGFSVPIDDDLYHSWQGQARRIPSLDDPGYFSLNSLGRDLLELSNRLRLAPTDAILDIGCGEKPYYPLFAPWTQRYVGIDIEAHAAIDCLVSPQDPLPFADASFALVLCTQVIEHVENPQSFIDEIHRVLKPGGTLYLSAPFVWEVHNYPNDYWRFTDQGLALLLRAFADVAITPQGRSTQGLLQAASLLVHREFPQAAWTRQLFALINEHLLPGNPQLADALLPAQFVAIARR